MYDLGIYYFGGEDWQDLFIEEICDSALPEQLCEFYGTLPPTA